MSRGGGGDEKDEMIVLDATVTDVINDRAFRAVLGNGHEVVGYAPDGGAAALAPGRRVRLRMSPFDMSRGERTGQEGL